MKRLIWLFVLLICTNAYAQGMSVIQDKTVAVRYLGDYELAQQVIRSGDTQATVNLFTEGRIVFFNKSDYLYVVSSNRGFVELRRKGGTTTYYVDQQYLQFA